VQSVDQAQDKDGLFRSQRCETGIVERLTALVP
jgi:hypothetical protein